VGEVRFTSEVSAPVAAVYAAHTDAARIPDWLPGVRAIEEISGPLDRVGTTVYQLPFGLLGRLVGGLPPVRSRAESSMREEIDSFARFVEHRASD
jgi:hypothetical protein